MHELEDVFKPGESPVPGGENPECKPGTGMSDMAAKTIRLITYTKVSKYQIRVKPN